MSTSIVDIPLEEYEDDIAILKDLLRNKFGVDSDLTIRQQQNRSKSELYINV